MSYKQNRVVSLLSKEESHPVNRKRKPTATTTTESSTSSSSESESETESESPHPPPPPVRKDKIKLSFIKGKVITSKVNGKMNIISTIFQNTMDNSEDFSHNTSEYDMSLLKKEMYM